MQPMNIPEITDERIAELLTTIAPVIVGTDGVPYTFDRVDLRGMSFIWNPTGLTPLPFAVVKSGTIRTLHTFGHPALFKPSIAEVLAQLPADVSGIAAFSIAGPEDADDLNREREALNAGLHVATVTLWSKA